ncbi:hypothetical protein AGMMS49546_26510 [Spirochaetia bacterium]|nr:hypothetical protein AGMMS49546_26510 [Spirochaetia bacterium]
MTLFRAPFFSTKLLAQNSEHNRENTDHNKTGKDVDPDGEGADSFPAVGLETGSPALRGIFR